MILRAPLLIVLTAIFITTQVSAQSFYKPGSVVTSNGQTIRGWIDYRQWEKNPVSIKFRETETGNPVIYTVKDLASFEVDGLDRYETAIITIDTRPIELKALERHSNDIVITDTVFLRLLVQGGLSLYEFEDFKPHFYIKEQGKEFQELFYKFYLVDSKLSEMFIFRDQFRILLSNTAKPDALMPLVKNATYKVKDLVTIVEKINSVVNNEPVTYKIAKQKQRPSLFAGVGVAHSTLKYSGSSDDLANLDYTSSAKPLITAGVDFTVSRNFQKLVLRLELSWYKLDYEGKNYPSSEDSIRYHVEMGNLAPSLSVLYNVLNYPRHKLYLGAGVVINLSNYTQNVLHRRYRNFSTTTTRSPYLDLEKGWVGINARAGFILNKKFEFATTAMVDGTFANFTGVHLSPFIISASVNYHF